MVDDIFRKSFNLLAAPLEIAGRGPCTYTERYVYEFIDSKDIPYFLFDLLSNKFRFSRWGV